MLKKGLAILAFALCAAPLFADVELSTSINDVFYRGSNELAGSITMRVQDDDFIDASTSEPVYIRVTLDHEATLSNTLVDMTSNDGAINDPIYLAMRLNAQGFTQEIEADPLTVSIVRWVEGESSLWIRVQTPSSSWVSDAGNLVPPRSDLTVSWTFGVSARASFETNDNLERRLLNLPFNTRNPATNLAAPDSDDSVSTLICVDLRDSSLTTSGVESLLNYDPIAFDERAGTNDPADGDFGEYSANGLPSVGINFTNDFSIARGKNRACTVEIGKGGAVTGSLCIDRAGLNQTQFGFVLLTNRITFVIRCQRNGDFLETALFRGSYVTFSTTGGLYGFKDSSGVLTSGNPASGETGVAYISDGRTGTSFTDHGETLYRTLDIIWDEAGQRSLNQFFLNAAVTTWYHFENGPVDVDLNWSITLVNHDGENDDAPFDGDDQHFRCPPSEFVIASGTWDFGSYVECSGVPVSIFFPYLPRLRGNDLFWSGLVVVNQGAVSLDVEASLYAENGDRFTAEFPELGVGEQYTWLLIEGESGDVGFQPMSDGNADIIVPVPDDASVDPASFGETRMSMFIRGTFSADYLDQRFLGDLDGYLLIGKDTDIDGSYLPRNYDNGQVGQNADLPLRRSKAGRGTTVVNEMGAPAPARFNFKNGRLISNN